MDHKRVSLHVPVNPTPVKPKQCTECPKSFNSAPALSRHRMNAHKIEPKKLFVCPLCKTSAKNRYFYRQHLLNTHLIQLFEEKHVFDTFQEFLTWKENMESETRTYFVRSRRVSAENRYDEYYNCNRTGSGKGGYEINQVVKKVDPDAPPPPKSKRCKTSKKIGGLCPANIKLNFNAVRNNFTVNYCTTHVGHALDDNLSNKQNRVKKRKQKANKQSDYISESDETQEGTGDLEIVDQDEYAKQVDETNLAIDSIVMQCSFGCADMSICPHANESAAAAVSSIIRPKMDASAVLEVVPAKMQSIQSMEMDLRGLPGDVIENLIAHYGTYVNEDGIQVLNLNLEPHNLPEQLLHLQSLIGASSSSMPIISLSSHPNNNNKITTEITAVIEDDGSGAILPQPITTLQSHHLLNPTIPVLNPATLISTDPAIVQDLLDKQEINALYRAIATKANPMNMDFVKLRLKEIIGTLESLELIGTYYKQPPNEEED